MNEEKLLAEILKLVKKGAMTVADALQIINVGFIAASKAEKAKEEYLTEFCEFCFEEQSKTTLRLNLGHLTEGFKRYKINKEKRK